MLPLGGGGKMPGLAELCKTEGHTAVDRGSASRNPGAHAATGVSMHQGFMLGSTDATAQ